MHASESGVFDSPEDAAAGVLFGIAIGLGVACIAMRAFHLGRLRGAEEVCDSVAAFRRGVAAARAAARPHVEREKRDGQ